MIQLRLGRYRIGSSERCEIQVDFPFKDPEDFVAMAQQDPEGHEGYFAHELRQPKTENKVTKTPAPDHPAISVKCRPAIASSNTI